MIKVVAALLCLALAVSLQVTRDRLYPRAGQEVERLLYVRSPQALDRMALGFDALAADIYWIRALQHFGGDRLSGRGEASPRYELLYPLLDITTSLDPYFNLAYRFGAIFLSEGYPGGAGRPDRAILLLKKGIANNPGKWEYYHDIGFVYYWTMGDREEAARWFQRAAAQPGAPEWLMPVAASMLIAANDRASARQLWSQIMAADEPWLRRSAERALAQLNALDQIDQLQALVIAAGRPAGEAYSWSAVIRRGRLRGIPLDPAGTPYEIDPATGAVSVARTSPLTPMPMATRR